MTGGDGGCPWGDRVSAANNNTQMNKHWYRNKFSIMFCDIISNFCKSQITFSLMIWQNWALTAKPKHHLKAADKEEPLQDAINLPAEAGP